MACYHTRLAFRSSGFPLIHFVAAFAALVVFVQRRTHVNVVAFALRTSTRHGMAPQEKVWSTPTATSLGLA